MQVLAQQVQGRHLKAMLASVLVGLKSLGKFRLAFRLFNSVRETVFQSFSLVALGQ